MNNCKYCANLALPHQTRCEQCRTNELQKKKDRRILAKANNICTICFKNQTVKTTKCKECLEAQNKRAMTLEHKRMDNNLCRECGNPDLVTERLCLSCRDTKRLGKHEYTISLRLKCVEAYGGKCNCCGCVYHEYLILDHVDGGGKEHRKTENGSRAIYLWAKRNNYPPLLQLLCANCHLAKHRHLSCPHAPPPHP
jgi:hypothetical protein